MQKTGLSKTKAAEGMGSGMLTIKDLSGWLGERSGYNMVPRSFTLFIDL